MATRTKTVDFAVQSDSATLAVSTNRDKTVTVYIPESSVTFKSVALVCTVRGDNTSSASITSPVLGLQLAAVAISEVTLPNPVANSGENEVWHFATDFTSYFTTNWTGTSMTATVRFRCAGVASANHCFIIRITYTYDDTSATQIKTVRFPLESTRSTLTTAFQTVGGATAIPQMTGTGRRLVENSPVIRNAFIELMSNESATSTTDFTLQTRANAGATQSIWRSEQSLNSSCWVHAIMDITSLDMSAARSFEALSSGVTTRFDNLGGWITVTYEFTLSGTTSVLNSLMLGAIDTAGWVGGTAAGDQDVWGRDIFIEEPGTITLRESGVFLCFQDSAGFTLNVAAGSQTDTAFTVTAGALNCGQFSLCHRIDAGGAKGAAGITLARGKNSYTLEVRSGTADAGWNLSGLLILNYESGVSAKGPGAHSHSVYQHIDDNALGTTYTQTSPSAAAPFTETTWWLVGACCTMWGTTDNSTNGGTAYQVERQAGEMEGDGWEPLYVGQFRSDNENQNFAAFGASRKTWQRNPLDPDASNRMDPQTTRSYRLDSNPPASAYMGLWWTYHDITFTSDEIDVDGYGGAGTGLTVDVFRDDTDEKVCSVSTGTDGKVTPTLYDNTLTYYAVCREDDTHVGRSKNYVPTGSP